MIIYKRAAGARAPKCPLLILAVINCEEELTKILPILIIDNTCIPRGPPWGGGFCTGGGASRRQGNLEDPEKRKKRNLAFQLLMGYS